MFTIYARKKFRVIHVDSMFIYFFMLNVYFLFKIV